MSESLVEWRPGVTTRLVCGASTGASQLCVIEQWCDPGHGAPTHTHHEVEEVILVRQGAAELWVGDRRRRVSAGESIVIPPYAWHGFVNTGADTLSTIAVFAAAAAPVEYEHEPGVILEVGGVGPEMRDPHRAVRERPDSLRP